MSRPDLDPRWEWVETQRLCDAGPTYVQGRCNHLLEVVPVESGGVVVAHLCLTCDAQLPAEMTRAAPPKRGDVRDQELLTLEM